MAIPKSIITFVNPAFSIEKTGSILITTGSVVTISAISSGSITFTPALSNYTQIRSASLSWLDSTSLGPFYSVTGGGYFPVIDSTAFSVLFSLNSTTTIITQSNSSFYFDSASIIGSNRKFSISYLSESKYTYYDNVADEAYIQLSVDTTSNENSIVFQNGVFNSTTGEVEFTSNTPVKGGIGTSARGIGSFAMGSGSIAQESASIAEGINTLASGLASHAAGINTTASGQAAFSMGIETDADGMASFAAGSGSWAKGTATVAMGIGTIASASGQTVVGHYNLGIGDFNNLFVVGGGSGATTNLRKNLFRVYGGSGASTVGVEINTSETQNISSFDGFNVYGKTRFFGGVTGSAIDFNAIGVDTKTILDPISGTITTGSFTSNFYRWQNALGDGPPTFEEVLKASVRLDHRGINFSLSEQTTAPGSTFLWTNSSDRLFYGSSAVILNDGNTLGSTMTIGTTDVNNLQLETNNTTRIFISSSGNVGIGKSNPTARLDISGSVITTGSLSITGSLSLKGPLYDNLGTAGTPDQILFTTSTGVEWRDNIANAAQDLVITGKNVGLTTIEKGTPLYFTGSGTAGNIVGILPADAGNPDRMPAGGVAGEQITAGSEGDVYIYGFISGVNTSAFSSGDDIFVAVGGGYTNTKPTGSAFIQKLGNVEKVDSSNGSGVIQGPSWYNDLPNWEIGRVMVGRSTGQPVTSSLVYLDEANGRLGLGTTSPTNTLQVVGGITATSITASIISASIGITGSLNVLSGNIKIDNSYKILGDSNHLTTYNYDSNFPSSTSASFGLVNIGGVGSYITAREDNLFGSSTILQFFTQGSERARITAGGRLGINTTTPGARLVVKGDSFLSSGVTFQALNSSDTTLLYVRDDGNVGIGTATPSTTLQVAGTSSLQHIIFDTNNIYDIGTSAVRARNIWSNGNVVGTTGYFNSAVMYNSARIGGEHTATALLHISGSDSAQMMRINSPTNANILFVSGSGNIGIGTATPSVRLHLSQSSGTFQRVDINNANADGVNATTEYYTNTGATPDLFGATSFRLQGGTTDAFKQFQVYIANLTSPRFIINGSGNVGINTTSPNARLHISGANNQALLIASSSTAPSALFVSGSGNVGIGTTSPTQKLDVIGRGYFSSGLSVGTTSTAGTGLTVGGSAVFLGFTEVQNGEPAYFYSSGNTYISTIKQQGDNLTLRDALYINGSGSVGIGTTSPTARLHISGANNGALLIASSSTAPSALFVSGSGNVGIGTATPTQRLDVRGNTILAETTPINPIGGTLEVYNNGSNAQITIHEDSGSAEARLAFRTGGNDTIFRNTSNRFLIDAESKADAIVINSDGRVGIGIGNNVPSSVLQIRGEGATSATTALRVENSAATARLTILDDGTSAFNTNHLYVSSSGNVGIGTATPTARLQIAGTPNDGISLDANNTLFNGVNARLPGRIIVGASSTGYPKIMYNAIPSASVSWSYSGNDTAWAINMGGGNRMGFEYVAPGTAGTSFSGWNTIMALVSGSNSVGIGTLTPTNTLQVVGGITATSITASIISASSGITGSLFGTSSWAVNALTASFLSGAFLQNGNSFGTTAVLGTNDTQNLQFETSGSVRITISSSGNVGIGTTTPSASLHVEGNFQISTGSLYTYGQNTDIDSGSFRTVVTVSTGSYRAAFFDYVLTSGSNARAGTVFSVWQGTSVEYADTSTNDIGNTTGVNLLVSMSGANIGLFASSSNDNWSMKALARML